MPKNVKDTGKGWSDPDDAPELTDDFFERAEFGTGDVVICEAQGTLTRRGRPKLDHPKRQVTVRLDGDLVDRLRESGPGWQSRINTILRKAVNI